MRYFLLPIIFLFFLNADTNNVDTSSFNYGWLMPIEFSYIDTNDDGALYHIGIGVGGFLEYDLFEIEISGLVVPFRVSNTLFSLNDKMNSIGDTFKWSGALFYKLNNNLQIGMDYSKYIFVTNEGELEEGTTYGYMSSYNIKFLYDPLADIMEQAKPLLMFFSLGYMYAPNIKYEKKEKIDYIIGRGWETKDIKRRYDLSGLIVSFGFIKKF